MISQKAKIISVTGGKGGIGKTSIAVNLALVLSRDAGKRVLLIDADFGLANIDLMLGLKHTKNITHVLNHECSIDSIITQGPHGIHVLPAGQGVSDMTSMSALGISGMYDLFSSLSSNYDFVILDTAAGISESVIGLTKRADEILVTVCNEPTSFADAYTVIKVLNLEYKIKKFRVLVNKVKTIEEGQEVFAKLTKVSDRFLQVNLKLFGVIPHDFHMLKAIQRRKAVVDLFPDSKSSNKFKQLACEMTKWSDFKYIGKEYGNQEIQVL